MTGYWKDAERLYLLILVIELFFDEIILSYCFYLSSICFY